MNKKINLKNSLYFLKLNFNKKKKIETVGT